MKPAKQKQPRPKLIQEYIIERELMKQAWQKRPKPKLIQEYHNFAANL